MRYLSKWKVSLEALIDRVAVSLQHPYWGSGPLIAKTAVSIASIIWGIIVLVESNPLDPAEFPLYMTMVWYMPANHWAVGSIAMGSVAWYRLMTKRPPMPVGALGYFCMMLFWCYLSVSIFALPLGILRPAQTSAVCVVGLLSIYAFLTNPKHDSSL